MANIRATSTSVNDITFNDSGSPTDGMSFWYDATTQTWKSYPFGSVPLLAQINEWLDTQIFLSPPGGYSIQFYISSTGFDGHGNYSLNGDSSNSWNINQNVSSGSTLFSVSYAGAVTTLNNTLDDSTGKIIAASTVAGIGFKTTAGAATTVAVGASPYTYTNSSASNQQVFIQGGTVSAVSFHPNGGTGISLSGLTDNVLTLRPNDTVTITYTAAPTVNTIQL